MISKKLSIHERVMHFSYTLQQLVDGKELEYLVSLKDVLSICNWTNQISHQGIRTISDTRYA